jgi:hypothetical protein
MSGQNVTVGGLRPMLVLLGEVEKGEKDEGEKWSEETKGSDFKSINLGVSLSVETEHCLSHCKAQGCIGVLLECSFQWRSPQEICIWQLHSKLPHLLLEGETFTFENY